MSTSAIEIPERIPFTLRQSKRAKRMRIVVKESGLEVTLPVGRKRSEAEKFVEANREWAIKNLIKVCGRVPTLPHGAYSGLPLFANACTPPPIRRITLAAIDKTVAVHYAKAKVLAGYIQMVAPSPQSHSRSIAIYCTDPSDPPREAVEDALREWIRMEAKAFLPGYINRAADKIGVRRPSLIRIGFQRTLWGSRSNSGTISLSAHLMFLPPHLLRHVAIHELCHTLHMNHGKRFHLLLEKLDPKTELHSEELKDARKYVPEWLRRDM